MVTCGGAGANGGHLGVGQQSVHPREDRRGQLADGQMRGQHQVGTGAAASQLEEGFPDPAVEVVRLGLQPVLGGVTGSPALPSHCRVNIQQDGEVGLQAGGGPLVQGPDGVLPQIASGALVGNRGINVAVRQHNLAALQRRPDHLGGMGSAGRRKNQRLSVGVNFAVAMVKNQGTQLLADGRPARLAGTQHCQSPGFKGVCKPGSLRRLAGTIAAFKRDEKSGPLFVHPTSLPASHGHSPIGRGACGQPGWPR